MVRTMRMTFFKSDGQSGDSLKIDGPHGLLKGLVVNKPTRAVLLLKTLHYGRFHGLHMLGLCTTHPARRFRTNLVPIHLGLKTPQFPPSKLSTFSDVPWQGRWNQTFQCVCEWAKEWKRFWSGDIYPFCKVAVFCSVLLPLLFGK